ncbi:MAG: HNH endonuclease signature motif containing protein [Desulforhabdus sp.]|jgi:hypothetical protein|nr:HNH endonuclease signature motif containing protein [Desulforhabdus sp.]
MSLEQTSAIERACSLISKGDLSGAAREIKESYPFVPTKKSARSYTFRQMTEVFLRDGFVDRYRGTRLIFPPVLRLISHYLPAEFPYHKNGKMSEGHMAYWELFPTIDHVHPVARGGVDSLENWVCCSMLTNSIKGNWTLEQLQWALLPPGSLTEWDGLASWFLAQAESDKSVLESSYIRRWHIALSALMPNHSLQARRP